MNDRKQNKEIINKILWVSTHHIEVLYRISLPLFIPPALHICTLFANIKKKTEERKKKKKSILYINEPAPIDRTEKTE